MRLLFIHQYFATPAGWGSQRMYEFGRRFAVAGHAVDVLCCAAYDPTLVGRRLVETGGMRVHVSRTRYRPQMGFAARVGAFVGFMLFCLWHVLRHGRQYDLVIASSGPLTSAVPALLAKWCYGRPFVFEVLDVWPDAAIDAGVLRNALLKRLAFALEARAYRQASHIVTCSIGMTARLLRKGVPQDKVSTIPHGGDLDVFAPDARRRAVVRAALGVGDEQMVVLYAGAMGRGNAIDNVMQTMKRTADDPRIVWWFAGDGAEAEKIRQLAGGTSRGRGVPGAPRTGVEGEATVLATCPRAERTGHLASLESSQRVTATVRFFGKVPRERIVELHQGADVVLVTFMHAPVFYENSPNKCFDALAAGLPVVFNRTTWLEADLSRYGCGFVCSGAKPEAEMAARIQELADAPALRQRMGEGARRLARKVFDRDRLAAEYLRIVEQCLKR